jgi:hypothetical protein
MKRCMLAVLFSAFTVSSVVGQQVSLNGDADLGKIVETVPAPADGDPS